MRKLENNDEAEELANQVVERMDSHSELLNKPDEELTEEEKQLKQKEIEKQKRKEKKKRYRKNKAKKKWYKAKINTNIYISGLPLDITIDELMEHFSKCGAVRIDPNTGEYKVKLYKDENGSLKGDALISFENIESLDTAIEMLDKSHIRPDHIITVQPAQFEMKGDEYRERKRQKVDLVKKKQIQAEKNRRFAFNEEQANQIGLKIVILKHLFTLDEVKDNPKLQHETEIDVKTEIESKWGKALKFEMFPDHPDGVFKVKFESPLEAEAWIDLMNGRLYDGREIIAQYWDGKEDFRKVKETEEEFKERVNEFEDWLNKQDVPDELKQKVETSNEPINDQNGSEQAAEAVENDQIANTENIPETEIISDNAKTDQYLYHD